MENTVL